MNYVHLCESTIEIYKEIRYNRRMFKHKKTFFGLGKTTGSMRIGRMFNPDYYEKNKRAREAVEQLITSSRLKLNFFVMCGLSGLLATLGILLNDTAILIGAMVLAPLINPVLAIAAGISLMNVRLVLYSIKSLVGAMLFVIILSAIAVKIFMLTGQTIDISVFLEKFRSHNLYLSLAAFISGFSGVYAWLRPTNQLNLVGVAIAVSLIPFVSFFGILLGMGEVAEFDLFSLLFIFNLLLIILGSVIAFMILGFSQKTAGAETVQQLDQTKNT